MPNWTNLLEGAGTTTARWLGNAAGSAGTAGRAVGSSLLRAGEATGTGLMRAGGGLAAAGRTGLNATAHTLSTPLAMRTMAGTAGGSALGAGTAALTGGDMTTGALTGGGLGALATNRPLRSMMFTPSYGSFGRRFPNVARVLRAAPYASSAVGAGIAYDAAANSSSNVAEDLAQRVGMTNPQDLSAVRSRAYWNYPSALWHARPTALGGDSSPFGTAVRNTLSTTFVPAVRAGVANVRTMYPTQANAIDLLRSTTPAGLGMTMYMRNMQPAQFPDIPAATRRELAAQLPNMMMAPQQTIQSPSFQLLRDTLFRNGEWSRINPEHAGRQLYAQMAGEPPQQQ